MTKALIAAALAAVLISGAAHAAAPTFQRNGTPITPLDTSSLYPTKVPNLTGTAPGLVAGLVAQGIGGQAIGVNFANGNTDTAVTIALPTGYTRYVVTNVRLSHASAPLTGASLGLNTGPGGSVAIVGNTAVNVSTSAENTSANFQNFAPGIAASFNLTTLYVRVGSTAAGTGDVVIWIAPAP